MANNNINVLQTLIQLRRGTEEQWDLVKDTFIPREGEPCTTIYDDGRDALIKIGDGKHTWGQLGYTRYSFLVTVTVTLDQGITADKTREEILKAVEQNKCVYVRLLTPTEEIFLPFLSFAKNEKTLLFFNAGVFVYFFSNGQVQVTPVEYMTASERTDGNFNAQDKSIVNLADSNELSSAVTKQYTDNSTPTFIFLEEQDGAIKSKVTDLNTLKTALMSQTNGYTQTSNPLYKAIKCYAVLDGNCYDLVYSSQENAQEAGKVAIVKRTFYAITTDGLNKLNVVIDENQTDENQKVVWTKEAQGVAAEQFIVTVQDVDGVNKSDKTPAEIKAAAEAGKQVILHYISYDNSIETGFLVSVVNDIASFCLFYNEAIGSISGQEWISILSDKTAKSTYNVSSPLIYIRKDNDGKYFSDLNPILYIELLESDANMGTMVILIDKRVLIGTMSFVPNNQELHVYFPDYANNKLYDLKWNGDENPSTYTFTELPFNEKPMVVTFTVTDPSTLALKADTPYADILKAANAGKIVYAFISVDGEAMLGQLVTASSDGIIFTALIGGEIVFNITMSSDSQIRANSIKLLRTSGSGNWYYASNLRIQDLGEPIYNADAVTKLYTDNSTPTFIYLEEQNGVIQSKTTDLETLKTALMSQTNGYTQTNNPLYKAVKCYAVLNDNCYDLVYSSQETQGAGKKDIVKRTFYAITTDGLNKLNVVVDENQTDKNKKVVWTKEAQGVASEQFIVTVQDVGGVDKSDKTLAEIMAAAGEGKQVILKEDGRTSYLVSVSPNSAVFLNSLAISEDETKFVMRNWYVIFSDQTVTINVDGNLKTFVIKKDGSGKYTSDVNPNLLLFTVQLRRSGQYVWLQKDEEEAFIGTIYSVFIDGKDVLHFCFPDYAKNKVYDLKYNGDDPATYTFTELSLGGVGTNDSVVIKSSTPNSTKKFRITVDDAGVISATEVVVS